MRSLILAFLFSFVAAALLPSGLSAQPANDDCAGAIELIPGVTCVPVAGTVLGATQSFPGTVLCDGFGATPNDDVWYRFTATSTAHAVQVDGDGAFDAVIQLWSGGCGGTPVVCRDIVAAGGNEILEMGGLSIGTEYHIRVFDWQAGVPATPTFTICIGPSVIPANDDCAGAVTLVPNPTCIPVAGTVASATASVPGTVLCNGFNADPNDDVWYRFVATAANHTITVTSGASFDAVVQLLSGNCNGTAVACQDVNSAGIPEVLNATGLTVGAQYLIRVFHYQTTFTATPGFTICVQGPAPSCTADASTLSPNRPEVCFEDGPTFIDAAFDQLPTVPTGYQLLHVLTTDPDLTIIATSATPEFTVDALGNYVIHTLVYDPATLDLSGIVLGSTQAGEVLAQLIQGGGSVCGSLDVAGAAVAVIECAECEAQAGTITADDETVCLDGTAELSATPDGNSNVPDGYAVVYVLTVGGDLIIVDAGVIPGFTVSDPGNYRIHTLVFDPTTFDIGIVELGVTTGGDVIDYIQANSLCASLDVAGAPISVEACVACDADAGTITTDQTPVCLIEGAADISATHDGNSVVPDGFEQVYVLTQGASLTIQSAGLVPNFTVAGPDTYTIHTLVYDPSTLDLSVIEFGVTTGFDVLDLIDQNGICASLDAAGAAVVVQECLDCDASAGTITANQSPVCLDGGAAIISATHDGNSVVPNGFEQIMCSHKGPH
ncbi:MAG: hypothetical protein IPJ85_07550 [Flavobacteriales bacterium]|nr:hypothetical protein [Flavobacteriales bacterium]